MTLEINSRHSILFADGSALVESDGNHSGTLPVTSPLELGLHYRKLDLLRTVDLTMEGFWRVLEEGKCSALVVDPRVSLAPFANTRHWNCLQLLFPRWVVNFPQVAWVRVGGFLVKGRW